MPTGDPPQNMYTPIPQNVTDSETEEEFHLQINHNPLKKNQIIARNFKSPNVHASISRYGVGDRQHIISDSLIDVRFTNTQSNYCNSDGEDRPYIRMSNHGRLQSDADNVAILNSNLRKSQPMSYSRKICFIISLLLCILTVILFIWILPCSDSNTCPAKSERIHTYNWLRNYERVELKGTINVVHGVRGRSMNLVFMYRGNNFFTNDDTNNHHPGGTISKRNGIISLIGSSGQVGWYDELVNEPRIIDCNLIDADLKDGTDCLIIDEYGEISCINPISGQWIWHLAEHTSNAPEKLNFPLVLPDINGDRVKDLLIACTVTNQNRTLNAFKLISGAKGTQIGQSFIVKNCSYIHKFQIDARFKVFFNCIINERDIRKMVSLKELYLQMTNQTIQLPASDVDIEKNQHKFYGQRKDTLQQRNIYMVNEKQLIVENYGICPDSCNVTVTLLDCSEQKGKPKIIRNFNGTRMYGMVPARLSFNKSNNLSQSGVHGFVIKFWEWSSNDTDKTDVRSHQMDKRTTTESNLTNNLNQFDDILRKKRSSDLPGATMNGNNNVSNNGNNKNTIKQKNVASTLSDKINSAVLVSQMRLIKETVVLIVFNSTDTRIENTSQRNIIQFCRSDSKRTEICQPDLNYQENSVLIADLDQDGSQELVSYYSTFVENENEVNKWKLMTYVQLLRLESELPKLYATDEKH